MATPSWGVTIDKKDERLTIARLQQVPEKTTEWTKQIVMRAALAGNTEMMKLAPEGHGSDFSNPALVAEGSQKKRFSLQTRLKLTEAYIRKNRAVRRPGGAGGGYSWQMILGPYPMPEYESFPTHDPTYILRHGSGERGGPGSSGARIHARAGNVLTFTNDGKQWFPQWTRGQRPNDRWFRAGETRARAVLRSNANTLKL